MRQSKKAEFLQLYNEFSEDYPLTEKGKEHISSYKKHRQQGRQNYQEVEAVAATGADITEIVLLKWIPYADTSANRDKDAWIHYAPCVSGDLVKKSENNGNIVNWPETAKTIFKFVKHCYDNPTDLETACQNYEASPHSKGFQTGYLTPILNALRSDEFLLINSKSQQSVNYFTDSHYSTKIADYPKINEAERHLIDSLASDMRAIWDSELKDDDQFDIFCHWLKSIKKHSLKQTKYWRISPGRGAWHWEECRAQGFIGIGWNELMDVSDISKQEFEAKRDEVRDQHPEWKWTDSGVHQVWRFSHNVEIGDRIVANRGTKEVLGIGTVTGPYYYQSEAKDHRHRLPVRWDDTVHRAVNYTSWVPTMVSLNTERFEEILQAPEIGGIVASNHEEPIISPKPNPVYSLAQCSKETYLEESLLQSWIKAINRKKQAILYGPPGTGKTYLAHRIARHLLSDGSGIQEIVQFHPAYTYEDFIEGIRPRQGENGGLEYPVVPGRFVEFCNKARQHPDTCIFIIDEINRANLAQVFGELMYLMEYRQHEITLPSGQPFSVPSNVRILGTMNTADRSIALVDHALRRRFAFLPLAPNMSALRQFHADATLANNLIRILEDVNQTIGDHHYHLGTSFFLQHSLEDNLQAIWQMEIEPYLEEYFFDRPEKLKQFCWDAIQPQLNA